MKNILIIGATSCIASACARLWVSPRTHFFLTGRDEEKLKQQASDLTARGASSVITYQMDALDYQQHPIMLKECLSAMHQIDLILIAHGTLPDQAKCEKDIAYALQHFANNGTSTIALMSLLAIQLEKQRCGTMAVISSVAGDRGRPSNYLYGAAKAAVSTFCEGLRGRLYKAHVHLLDIRPGFVDTPMTQELQLPKSLLTSPERLALIIDKGIRKRKDVLYAPGFWGLIMFVIRCIPRTLFKKLSL